MKSDAMNLRCSLGILRLFLDGRGFDALYLLDWHGELSERQTMLDLHQRVKISISEIWDWKTLRHVPRMVFFTVQGCGDDERQANFSVLAIRCKGKKGAIRSLPLFREVAEECLTTERHLFNTIEFSPLVRFTCRRKLNLPFQLELDQQNSDGGRPLKLSDIVGGEELMRSTVTSCDAS